MIHTYEKSHNFSFYVYFLLMFKNTGGFLKCTKQLARALLALTSHRRWDFIFLDILKCENFSMTG